MTDFIEQHKVPVMLQGGVAIDDRGSVKFVNGFDFQDVKRFYQVANHRRGFIRAWHYHDQEGKYAYVVKGSAIIAVLKKQKKFNDFRLAYKGVLSSEKPAILWIPPGHANGFMTLEEGTIIQFFSTSSIEETKGDDIRYDLHELDNYQEFMEDDAVNAAEIFNDSNYR